MAKLYAEKQKYGVSVAARIDPGLAHQIADRADRLGISFARLVGMLIAHGFKPQEPIVVENHEKLDSLWFEVTLLSNCPIFGKGYQYSPFLILLMDCAKKTTRYSEEASAFFREDMSR